MDGRSVSVALRRQRHRRDPRGAGGRGPANRFHDPQTRTPVNGQSALPALKARALKALDGLEAETRDLALRIHAHPETGFEEHQAVAWITEMLERHGLAVERGIAQIPTAIAARTRGAAAGSTVGLIAEYDALAGLGHACGHNLMGAGMAAAPAARRQHIRPDARVHGIITDGGQAVNIIPERAAAEFGVRSTDGAYVRELMGRVEACARAAAEATGTTVAVSHGPFFDSLKYVPALAGVVRQNARTLGFEMAERQVGASTDLGNLSQAIPTVSYTLPTCPPGVGMHTREALEAGASELGLRGMMNDARVMVTTAIDLLASPEILETVRAEFRGGNSTGF